MKRPFSLDLSVFDSCDSQLIAVNGAHKISPARSGRTQTEPISCVLKIWTLWAGLTHSRRPTERYPPSSIIDKQRRDIADQELGGGALPIYTS